MPIFSSSKLKQSSYFIFVFIIIPLLIGTIGFTFLHLQRQTLINEKHGDLATIADLKVSAILQWRKERIVEGNSIHTNAIMSNRIYEFTIGNDNSHFLNEFRIWAENLTDIAGYRRVLLFNPDGKLLASYSDDNLPLTQDYREMIDGVIKEELIVLTDLYLEESIDRVSLNLLIPIVYYKDEKISTIAVLVLEIDPYKDLYPIIQSWPSFNKSAETLLVRKEGEQVLFLNELRFLKNTAMKLRRPLTQKNMPATQAVLGEEGVFEGVDYRGESVQSAVRTIPGSTWSMVAKIDTEEVVEPMATHVWYVTTACVILICALVFGVSFWWKRKEKEALQVKYEDEVVLNAELNKIRNELQQAHSELEKRVEERTSELQKSQNLFSDLSRQVPGLIFQFQLFPDGSYCFPFVSDSVNIFSGVTAAEVMSNPDVMFDMVFPEDYEGVQNAIRASAQALHPWYHECRVIDQKKEVCWRSIIAQPQLLDDGSVLWNGIISDITEKKQLAHELFEARKLESIGQIAAGVAHEVRNPLNAILSITEALFKEKEIESNEEFEPYIQHIRTQVKRLAQLMNDLLDLGKEIPSTNLIPITLFQLCSETISLWMASGAAESKHIMLVCHQDYQTLQVMADRDKLQQVLFNLVENAAQHSPKDGKVILEIAGIYRYDTAINMAVIRVIDAGKGISPEKINRVFDPFYSGRKGGTGLGLALAKHFIENMSGTVIISNNSPLPGCTAEIQIPVVVKGLE